MSTSEWNAETCNEYFFVSALNTMKRPNTREFLVLYRSPEGFGIVQADEESPEKLGRTTGRWMYNVAREKQAKCHRYALSYELPTNHLFFAQNERLTRYDLEKTIEEDRVAFLKGLEEGFETAANPFQRSLF